MTKKNALLLVVLVVSSNCFGMKKSSEPIFPPTKVSFNPNPVGQHQPKEFECKTKDELTMEFIKDEFVMVPTEVERNAERAEKIEDESPNIPMILPAQMYWQQKALFKKTQFNQ